MRKVSNHVLYCSAVYILHSTEGAILLILFVLMSVRKQWFETFQAIWIYKGEGARCPHLWPAHCSAGEVIGAINCVVRHSQEQLSPRPCCVLEQFLIGKFILFLILKDSL